MGGTAGAKRKAQEAKQRSRPSKRFKKQAHYSSGSESEADAENSHTPALQEERSGSNAVKVSRKRDQRQIPPADDDGTENVEGTANESSGSGPEDAEATSTDAQTESEDDSQDDDDDTEELEASQTQRKPTKRRDPEAFASSINAILSSKLTTTNRKDPVLARSKTAATASHELNEARLEAKAKRKLRDEKRALNERGRVRNVLLGDRRRTPGLSESEAEDGMLSEAGESSSGKGPSAAEIAEQERRLKKTAQRGVVKLFNAVRAAQVKAEEASRDAKTKSIVGVQRREDKVDEMSRQAFLDLVSKGDFEPE